MTTSPIHGPRRTSRTGKGSVSLFLVVLLLAVFAVFGLVVDGGARLDGQREATNQAEQAARAAAQAVNPTSLRTGTATLDPTAARAAASRYLTAAGNITLTGIHVIATTVTISVTTTVQPAVLSIIGIHALTVTGTGRAQLLRGNTRPGHHDGRPARRPHSAAKTSAPGKARGVGSPALCCCYCSWSGIPAVLIAVAGVPFTHGLPSAPQLFDRLRQPDDGQLLLDALLIVAWAGWAAFTAAVAAETMAPSRNTVAPALVGLGALQPVAGRLLASAALLLPASTVLHLAPAPAIRPATAPLPPTAGRHPPSHRGRHSDAGCPQVSSDGSATLAARAGPMVAALLPVYVVGTDAPANATPCGRSPAATSATRCAGTTSPNSTTAPPSRRQRLHRPQPDPTRLDTATTRRRHRPTPTRRPAAGRNSPSSGSPADASAPTTAPSAASLRRYRHPIPPQPTPATPNPDHSARSDLTALPAAPPGRTAVRGPDRHKRSKPGGGRQFRSVRQRNQRGLATAVLHRWHCGGYGAVVATNPTTPAGATSGTNHSPRRCSNFSLPNTATADPAVGESSLQP